MRDSCGSQDERAFAEVNAILLVDSQLHDGECKLPHRIGPSAPSCHQQMPPRCLLNAQ